MAIIDLATKLGANIAPSVHGTRFPVHYAENVIDLAVAAAAKGSALAASDVIEAVDVPAQSIILAAGIEVISAQVGATVMTLDLGVTGIDVDAYVDGFDYITAVAGDYAQQPAAYQPIVIGNTADTVDVLLATVTGTATGGKIRVWVLYGDVKDTRNPGLALRKS